MQDFPCTAILVIDIDFILNRCLEKIFAEKSVDKQGKSWMVEQNYFLIFKF